MINKLSFTIPLVPITKKNSQIIIRKNNRFYIVPSKKFRDYEKACGDTLSAGWSLGIDYPVNVKAVYYMPTRRRVDLTNLHEALHDVLVHYNVLADDNCKIIVSTDGSRVKHDKENPRTEVVITALEEQE